MSRAQPLSAPPLLAGLVALALVAGCDQMPLPPDGRHAATSATVPDLPAEPVAPAQPIQHSTAPVLLGVEAGGTNPATGLPQAAIVNYVPRPDGLVVYYREAMVPEAEVAATADRICRARDADVASAHTRSPENPAELPGIRILTVQCNMPAPLPTPAAISSTSASETAVQKGSNP